MKKLNSKWVVSMTVTAALAALSLTAMPAAYAGAHGGTDVGGSDAGSKFVAEWCQGSQGILVEYLNRSHLSSDVLGDQKGAVEILSQGLVAALSQNATQNPNIDLKDSLMHRALERGLEMNQLLQSGGDGSCDSSSDQLVFLQKYYDFVLNVVTQLDVGYQIPYVYNHGQTGPAIDIGLFEKRFAEYAVKQVNWVFDSFTLNTDVAGVTSRINPKSYLRILEHVTKSSGDDLMSSLWNAKYACAIQLLSTVNSELAAHNAGNLGYFVNDRFAINITYNSIHQGFRLITSGCQ